MLKPFADEDSVYRLLEPVQRAPSVHNTQPWYFRIAADDRIDICARFGDRAGTEFAMNGNGRLPVSPACAASSSSAVVPPYTTCGWPSG